MPEKGTDKVAMPLARESQPTSGSKFGIWHIISRQKSFKRASDIRKTFLMKFLMKFLKKNILYRAVDSSSFIRTFVNEDC